MEQKHLPVGYAALWGRINAYARRNRISASRIQKIVTITEVIKMLPKDTLVKGGNSLSIRFPLLLTRSSVDLDLAVIGSEQQWQEKFEENLVQGVDGFIGRLVVRGKQLNREVGHPHHLPHSLPHFQMWPMDVHLEYNKRDFSKLPLDVTPDFDHLQPVTQTLSTDVQKMMLFIGLSLPQNAVFVNPLSQLRDKAASMYYTWPDRPRPHDLKDLTLLDPSLLEGEPLDPRAARMIIQNVISRGAVPIMSDEALVGIASAYEADGFGPFDQAVIVMKTVDQAVQQELRLEHIEGTDIRKPQAFKRHRHSPHL